MGGAGIFGSVERVDFDVRGESGASAAAVGSAGACGRRDFGFVLEGSARAASDGRWPKLFHVERLAFLAALVPASFLFVLLWFNLFYFFSIFLDHFLLQFCILLLIFFHFQNYLF